MVDAHGREQAGLAVRGIRDRLQGRFVSVASRSGCCPVSRVHGVPAHFGVSIEGIEDVRDGVLVTLSARRVEQFDLVVGADGLHSRVRELIFGAERWRC